MNMNKNLLILFFLTVTIQRINAQNYHVTEAEALNMAHAIEKSVKNKDAAALSDIFDLTALTDRIKAKSLEIAKAPTAFFDGFKSTFTMNTFGTQMISNLQDGSYELLRTYETDNKRHLLFRAFGKSGLNYHDYTLIKKNNTVKASDVYVYITAEEMSTTLADLIDVSLAGSNNTDVMSDELKTLLKLKTLKQKNDLDGIINLYESLDNDYKKNRGFQVIYISACQKKDQEKYKEALESYAALYPNATNSYFLLLDLYFLNKQYDKAHSSVNKLDSLVGGDPFLDFYRANIYLAMEDNANAKLYYDKVFQVYPTLAYVIKNVIILHMNDGEKDIAKEALKTYKSTEGYNEKYIDEIYAEYPELKE